MKCCYLTFQNTPTKGKYCEMISSRCVSAVALPGLGGQYPVFSTSAAPKMMDDGKLHGVEHLINPLTLQHDHTAGTAVLPSVSTPPPYQVLYRYTHIYCRVVYTSRLALELTDC